MVVTDLSASVMIQILPAEVSYELNTLKSLRSVAGEIPEGILPRLREQLQGSRGGNYPAKGEMSHHRAPRSLETIWMAFKEMPATRRLVPSWNLAFI